ncbi:MAG: hypothetical protein QGI46_13275 [Planctomycetota bacterium]|nr:hypothetical protein [Planctomycetota bacterium]
MLSPPGGVLGRSAFLRGCVLAGRALARPRCLPPAFAPGSNVRLFVMTVVMTE